MRKRTKQIRLKKDVFARLQSEPTSMLLGWSYVNMKLYWVFYIQLIFFSVMIYSKFDENKEI